VNIIGWDIGGVNTKAALIKTRKGKVRELKTAIEYFPVWKRGKEKLPAVLEKLRNQLAASTRLDGVGVTMTAELSDAYRTKRNGVNHILTCVAQVFTNTPIYVLDAESNLKSIEEARREPLKVAAANWPATGWMVSQAIKDCFIIDVGSTTTSIIPVIERRVVAAGKTDLDKLLNGELVYTGALRTNVATIVNSIPVRGGIARVSSELFASSGDVHLILGNISEKDYTVETADGRGTTKIEARGRLARVVCADIEMLNEKEMVEMANYVYEAQIKQIADGLRQVYDRVKSRLKDNVPVVVTGLGRDFLARKAAQKAGFNEIIDLGELLGGDAAVVSTSVGVALMVASKLEGKVVRW
jgi:hypothetical protein